jgi:hypothetical protein ELI_1895
MFVIDSLIGNTDRHNGNWGFLVNKSTDKIKFSPIYDCGSCLNPIIEDDEIVKMNETEIKNLALNCYSCIKEDGKKINCMSYIKSLKNAECTNAVKRLIPNIDITKIIEFIANISCISYVRKDFYKKSLMIRYDIIKSIV